MVIIGDVEHVIILNPVFNGELAQLARAPALHAGGQGFDSLILHKTNTLRKSNRFFVEEFIHFWMI